MQVHAPIQHINVQIIIEYGVYLSRTRNSVFFRIWPMLITSFSQQRVAYVLLFFKYRKPTHFLWQDWLVKVHSSVISWPLGYYNQWCVTMLWIREGICKTASDPVMTVKQLRWSKNDSTKPLFISPVIQRSTTSIYVLQTHAAAQSHIVPCSLSMVRRITLT